MPAAPCIPTRAVKPPAGCGWVHEIKHDGYRLQVRARAAPLGCLPAAAMAGAAGAGDGRTIPPRRASSARMASLCERRPQSLDVDRDERSLEPKQRRGDDFERGAGVVQLSEIENAEPCV
jgi:hypothetical protein